MKVPRADIVRDLSSDVEGLNQLVTWQLTLVRDIRSKVASLLLSTRKMPSASSASPRRRRNR